MQVEFEIQRATDALSIPDDEQFGHWINEVLSTQDQNCALTIRLVDEPEARRFNKTYRQRDYATNVLSFPAELPEGLPVEVRQAQLGDILICAPVVAREAREQNRPQVDHWAHLTIHGVLHLLGYDHEQPDEAAIMEALETKILEGLGVSDPYIDIS